MMKNLLVMAAMLSMSFAFVGCSNKDLYEDGAEEKAKQVETVAKYQDAFVSHFGAVASNQCWDFTQPSVQSVMTRAGSEVTWTQTQLGQQKNYPHIAADYEEARSLAESNEVPLVEWPFEYAEINLYPFYGHAKGKYTYFFLGLNDNYLKINVKDDKWYSLWSKAKGTENLNFNTYRHINTTNASNVEWWIGCAEPNFNNDLSTVTKYNLTKCKCFNVNGHTYVAFDCNNDKDYTDLICWVEDITPSKRYMVEDLGEYSDFDFNDIVFDVRPKSGKKNQYECLVRALGGTLDVTIKVGDTEWKKSKVYKDVTQMLNTLDPDYGEVLARFDVKKWVPKENKVSVTVEGKNGAMVLPFPKDGEIPFMVAVSVGKEWSKEYVDVRNLGWFTSPNEIAQGDE